MPSPSAISKFVLGTLKFFKHTQFSKYTQNVLSTLHTVAIWTFPFHQNSAKKGDDFQDLILAQ